MNKIQTKILDLAFALFEDNSEIRCQHFAFLTFKNRIVSIGRNTTKTTPRNLLNPKNTKFGVDISSFRGTCAEFNCLRQAKNLTNVRFKNCSLFIVRVNRNREIAYSKPCGGCLGLINFFNIREVFYTVNSGEFVGLNN